MKNENLMLKISCNNCKKCKLGSLGGRDGMYYCVIRGPFHYTVDRPCCEWLPAKEEVRVHLARHMEAIKKAGGEE